MELLIDRSTGGGDGDSKIITPPRKVLQLFGRTKETERVCQWFFGGNNNNTPDHASSTPQQQQQQQKQKGAQLLVVSGPVGIGKRTLVESTFRHQRQGQQQQLLFLSGRYYSQEYDTSTGKIMSSRPYGAICDALNRLVPILDQRDDDDVHKKSSTTTLRKALSAQFTSSIDREALTELVDPIAKWLFSVDKEDKDSDGAFEKTQQQPLRSSSSTGVESKAPATSTTTMPPVPFVQSSTVNVPKVQCGVLIRFIQAIASHVPLVLYLQNWDYASQASIELIEKLLQIENHDNNNNNNNDDDKTSEFPVGKTGLFIIVSMVDESLLPTSISQYCTQQSRIDERSSMTTGNNTTTIRVETLRLTPLSRDHVVSWMVEHFAGHSNNNERLDEIVDLVYENSSLGNPLHIRFLVSYISLSVDPEWSDETLDRIHAVIANNSGTTSLNDVYVQILQCASSDVQNLVQLVAVIGECGGCPVRVDVLNMALRTNCTGALMAATELGLLLYVDDDKVDFPLPEIQKIVYTLIPEEKRAPFHLRIGRKLWKNEDMMLNGTHHSMMTDEMATALDIIARNLHQGLDLVTDPLERDVIVAINLRAGKHAAFKTSFAMASNYFEFARAALGEDRVWTKQHYDVSLMLYNCASEAYYCIADFDRMGTMLDAVFQHAQNFHDKLQAYTLLVYANGSRDRLKDALDAAFEVLTQLKEPIPTNAGKLTMLLEYYKTKRKVGGKPTRYFLNLPIATDEDKIAAMQMMNFAMIYSYAVNPYCGMISAFRLLRLALKHGLAAPAITAFGAFGYVNCLHMGKRELGVQFGQISLALLDQINAKRYFLPRIYFFAHGILNRWAYPLRDSLEPLRLANRSAFKTGDMEACGLTAYYYLELAFLAGKPLAVLEYEARLACQDADEFDQFLVLLHLVPFWSILYDMLNSSKPRLLLQGDITDSDSALDRSAKDGNKYALSQYYYMQTMHCCWNAKYYETIDMAQKSRDALPGANFWLRFCEGLAALAIARNVKGKKHRYFLSIGRMAVKYIRKCAKTCPSNFPNKQTLLEAELATIEGNTKRALGLFYESIRKAQDEGFIHEVGLAYERLGLYHVYLDCSVAAVPCFEAARDAYLRWGAHRLVDRMEGELRIAHES